MWNNRICQDENGFFLAEVYYDGTMVMGNTEPLTGYFDTKEELIEDLELKLEDARRSFDKVIVSLPPL